jgi:DNA-binding transcriptional ArsR family regulator
MVEYSTALDLVFRALGDPTRRQMVATLDSQERSVSELARPLNMTLAAVLKHVLVLERAGIVHRSKRGRTHYCRLDPKPLAAASQWLEVYRRLWNEQLDKLEEYLARNQSKGQSDA